MEKQVYALGIDFGTSGARAIAIDRQNHALAEAHLPFPATPEPPLDRLWQSTLFALIEQVPIAIRQGLQRIAINGTSSTVLLCDGAGTPLREPLLYSDDRGRGVLEQVRSIAPPGHTVISATSSLAKLFWFLETQPSQSVRSSWIEHPYFLHQADWLAFLLHGKLGVSDYHNALKLGYDVVHLAYPNWLTSAALPVHLPTVLAPGTPIAPIQAPLCDRLGLPKDCWVCAGTTDSIAAFLASGAQSTGEAVTSLGSTLVLKLLSKTRVEASEYGIYSHRLGELWLVGGASNTGGAVLRQFFTDGELAELSRAIDPDTESPLDYYPLPQPGERFPINDPDRVPCLTPRPDRPEAFLHGLLESMARIEALGYQRLQALGATPLTRVYTAGGGAQNPVWTAIRARRLGVPVLTAHHREAAYGTALLAKAWVA